MAPSRSSDHLPNLNHHLLPPTQPQPHQPPLYVPHCGPFDRHDAAISSAGPDLDPIHWRGSVLSRSECDPMVHIPRFLYPGERWYLQSHNIMSISPDHSVGCGEEVQRFSTVKGGMVQYWPGGHRTLLPAGQSWRDQTAPESPGECPLSLLQTSLPWSRESCLSRPHPPGDGGPQPALQTGGPVRRGECDLHCRDSAVILQSYIPAISVD